MRIGHKHSSFQKKKKKIVRQKQNFCNADADAEMPTPRFPNGTVFHCFT